MKIWSHLMFSGVSGWVEPKTSFWHFAWQIGYGHHPFILSDKNREGGWGVLLNGQNPLSVTKVICWQSLSLIDNINRKIKKATKRVNVVRKMNLLLRHSLLIIHKSFVRPHLNYGNVIYDQPNKSCLSDKIRSWIFKVCVCYFLSSFDFFTKW